MKTSKPNLSDFDDSTTHIEIHPAAKGRLRVYPMYGSQRCRSVLIIGRSDPLLMEILAKVFGSTPEADVAE